MKRLSLAVTFAISLALGVSAQVKPNLAANNHPNTQKSSAAVPAPAIGTRARFSQLTDTQQWGNAPLASAVVQPRQAAPNFTVPTSVARPSAVAPSVTAALTQTYRVGTGDILDIQIPDSLSNKSTLYTVGQNGMIDYPLASGPIQVTGLTTDAIAARLKASIRVLDRPPVMVKVRDFASHSVNVIGFVYAPGAKILRREAVPLYVVLAEATPLDDATSVTVIRNGRNIALIDLRDLSASSQLIVPGDVIKVSDRTIGAR